MGEKYSSKILIWRRPQPLIMSIAKMANHITCMVTQAAEQRFRPELGMNSAKNGKRRRNGSCSWREEIRKAM
jgi:hypothetical protein